MFIGAELADPMTAAATWGMLHGVAGGKACALCALREDRADLVAAVRRAGAQSLYR